MPLREEPMPHGRQIIGEADAILEELNRIDDHNEVVSVSFGGLAWVEARILIIDDQMELYLDPPCGCLWINSFYDVAQVKMITKPIAKARGLITEVVLK